MRKWLIVSWMSSVFLLGPHCLAAPLFESTLGVNHHFTQDVVRDAKDIADTAAAGFRLIRYDMTWEQVERSKGIYDFSVYDRLLEQMSSQSIRPMFILNYGNPLYGESLSARTPESREAFAKFAAAAAARYRGRNIIWEIWNEPNIDRFWSPNPNPYEYLSLVIEAATAIRSEDPQAYIVGGAVSGVDISFLAICIRHGMLNYVDAVSVHPYRRERPETVLPDYEKLSALIRKYQPAGKNVALVSGEWGYTTMQGRSEEEQARYFPRMMLLNVYAGIDFSIWYDFRDDGTDKRNGEHNFGLYRFDGREKPVLAAVRELSRNLTGKHFMRRLSSRSDDFLLEFVDSKGKACLAAWTVRKDHLAAVSGRAEVYLTQTPQFLGCQ